MALAGVEGAVGGDAGDLLVVWDLVEQFGQHGRVAHVAGGELGSPDFQGFLVDTDVDLAPDPTFSASMLAGVPFALALDLDASAVDQQMQRSVRTTVFLDDGHVDIDSNLVENAIRSPAMNRRNALFAGHDEGGKNWARFASLIGTCKMNGVEPHVYLRDLFTKLANGHLAQDIEALMPWAYDQQGRGA
jgi:hypothetical protein